MRDASCDVAIVGISARFPGANDINTWWNSLLKGEILTKKYNHEEIENNGILKSYYLQNNYVPVRGHLDNILRFDNRFFNVNNRDAEIMDPQYRLMLETAWSALEDAGYGKKNNKPITGVFASCSTSSYMYNILFNGPYEPDILEQIIHGNEKDFIASIIAYKLNLIGPAISIQTACSSSLVGLHLAKQSLLNKDCDLALVVAAAIPFPQGGYLYHDGGIYSKNGKCRPFDAKADGVIEGSGVACVVLKRLEDINENDVDSYAVILGSAVNNDGSSKVGYFAPSITGQKKVIKQAINNANIDISKVSYIEMHGTGTVIGDPIEWTSTSESYQQLGARTNQIAIGSVKANIGHLDAAAGLASLIKTIMILKTNQIPPLTEEFSVLSAAILTLLFNCNITSCNSLSDKSRCSINPSSHCCIDFPRIITNFNASCKDNTPEIHIAVNSPKLCPNRIAGNNPIFIKHFDTEYSKINNDGCVNSVLSNFSLG